MIREVARNHCTIIFGYFDLFIAMRNMDPKSFHKSSYRSVTHATTMSEVRNLVETIERTRSVVLLTPAGGDECDQGLNNGTGRVLNF